MKVSVIVPIYNAEKFLDDFFSAIEMNCFYEGDEVILVDNGSTDASFEICENRKNARPDLYKQIKYDKTPGSYAARNYAIRNSTGDVLIFTDSDTKPANNWIDTIRKNIKPSIVIAGKIQLDISDKKNLWENFDSIAHLNSEENAKISQIATANMAVSKSDFYMVGEFEERFSGGDYDWSIRAAKAGLNIVFQTDVLVHHPTRKTFEQILTKERRIAYGYGNHWRIKGGALWKLKIIYILKVFKFDTNIKYMKKLADRGLTVKDIWTFNIYFFRIRIEQYKQVINGFNYVDARQLAIK